MARSLIDSASLDGRNGDDLDWSRSTPAVLGLLLLQLGAAVLGGWAGRRMALSGVEIPE
jgi:hypothetical protein